MDFGTIVEQKIQEAIEQGKFDNLRGRGKPLKLRDDPFEDPAWRLANDILEAGGFVPDWIEMDRDLREATDKARVGIRRTLHWANEARTRLGDPHDLEAERQRDFIAAEIRLGRERFVQAILKINRGIAHLNLKVPSGRLQRVALNLEGELAQVGLA